MKLVSWNKSHEISCVVCHSLYKLANRNISVWGIRTEATPSPLHKFTVAKWHCIRWYMYVSSTELAIGIDGIVEEVLTFPWLWCCHIPYSFSFSRVGKAHLALLLIQNSNRFKSYLFNLHRSMFAITYCCIWLKLIISLDNPNVHFSTKYKKTWVQSQWSFNPEGASIYDLASCSAWNIHF